MNQSEHEPSWSDYVDVTIVEFATHTAYLDPRTGTGYLVTPDPDLDIPAPDEPFVGGLSLHTADFRRALSHLEEDGWQLLYDDEGKVERAGLTVDGRTVVCLFGAPTAAQPSLETLRRALIALDLAAAVDPTTRHPDDDQPPDATS
ncbi:hypothetical protein EV652_112215 [Kribbella steppae]|uniref:Uncharacterized protein n=1 Tax=Kribbella steppae TaxID=2512223 RepID=A0A4R2H4Y5_9ACTN|nr:hypothetical protein [Kribbella steppae]TCO20469.1 hypothetical protein EV652_112215 [Kribbella steppae]